MIRIKVGVRIDLLQPQMMLVLINADQLWHRAARADAVITSGNDGRHSPGSKHYQGLALDLRTRMLPDPERVATQLAGVLGENFDVVLEGRGTINEHIHVEFDPPRPAPARETHPLATALPEGT